MCGIVGLFAKSPAIEERLGVHLVAMLAQMSDRGPDSAGVAVYRDPVAEGLTKLTLYSPRRRRGLAGGRGGDRRRGRLGAREPRRRRRPRRGSGGRVPRACASRGDLRVMSAGRVIEIYKDVGLPEVFAETFELANLHGSHALGHTRMATESRVTTEGSHPFSTGLDLCLVHNGSLSNHNTLRRMLRREGIEFQTENDTEVAAGYLEWRLREGASLEQALEGCLDDLDGFYTFAVGTADGFAVLRDPIACKPAVLAETDDWVAMASEYHAIAVLPGADDAADVGARAGDRLRLGSGGRRMSATLEAEVVDLAVTPLRELNQRLHDVATTGEGPRRWRIVNPKGAHAVACGLDAELDVEIDGHVGYYCAGMNKLATVRVHGNASTGIAENMMSGLVVVEGSVSQSAGATAHGGLLVVHGDAAARCGISMKGVDIVVRGSVGHLSAFMAQTGNLVVCGDAGDALGDSIYEARLYVRGTVAGLGADCIEKEMREEHVEQVRDLLAAAGIDDVDAADFRRYGSARQLYNFTIDNAGAY